MERLPRAFYDRPTLEVARDLLGRTLVRMCSGQRLSGRIVEVEAYLGPTDPASHARHGETSRAAPMFGEPSYAYVYFTYGMYHCLNCVTEGRGSGTGILIRAVEPIEGIETMRQMREVRGKPVSEKRLTNGPGKLAQALSIDLELNRADLVEGPDLWLENGEPVGSSEVATSARIGLTHGRDHPHRFYVKTANVSAHPKY